MSENDIDWELEEGVPQIDDPFIQQYLKGRTSLILEENKQRYDTNFRKALSPTATKACEIVSRICARGLTTEGLIKGNGTRSGHYNSLSHSIRDQVQETDLWRILQRMPKGSLLHAHTENIVDIDHLIDQAFATTGIHLYAPKPLVVEDDQECFYFRYLLREQSSDNVSTLWEATYKPLSLISLQEAASSFPKGGEAGFRDWLKKRFTAVQRQSNHLDDDGIWVTNRSSPAPIYSLLSYEPIFRSCLKQAFAQLAADGISDLELRHEFTIKFTREGSSAAEDDYFKWCRVFQEELQRFRTIEGHDSFGARVIWTASRTLSNKEMSDSMVDCILAKQEYPGIICGFDVVGHGDHCRSLVDLVPILFWFRKQCAEEGTNIPFLFHAGGGLGDEEETGHDLFDAILLGTRRIGEGNSLYKHPLLVELVKEKKILVECCSFSNNARPTNYIQGRPLSVLLSRGVPVSLCSDPRGIGEHGLIGLTAEFWQALQGPDKLDLPGLAMIVENSIRWSCYEDQSAAEWLSDMRGGILGKGLKATRLREWYTNFEKFCEWVTVEFANLDTDD
ncbi:hypothetical protein BDV25DRAFT_163706 [Aspergillus avenaceus]|uniref:adenosine deaminase n=1 Tax=Aspergillus avenaceus TaxID=36643 RepID=A0A5N6THP9_ASPAV|nr:hypothetical protein BDV25DRAFT_163706 [Aspergillus avenaceus]